MMRFVGFILVCLFTLAALAASDRAKPLVVIEAHPSGHWLFNEADYQRCIAVQPPPLKAPVSMRGLPVVQPLA